MKSTEIKLGESLAGLIDASGARGHRKKIATAIGVTAGALSQYVNDQSRPSLDKLVALAGFFEVTLDRLVFGPTTEPRYIDRAATQQDQPMIAFIDHSLGQLQQRIASQESVAGRIGQLLAERIGEAAREIAATSGAVGGMMLDDETLVVETHSRRTTIVSLDLTYDVTEVGGEQIPGRFLEAVAQNLAQGRPYRFLLPADFRDWTDLANGLRELLRSMGAPVHTDLLAIRQVKGGIYAPLGIMDVDWDALSRQTPILADRLSKYASEAGALGYVIAVSADQLADSLMSPTTLALTERVIEDLWSRAQAI